MDGLKDLSVFIFKELPLNRKQDTSVYGVLHLTPLRPDAAHKVFSLGRLVVAQK